MKPVALIILDGFGYNPNKTRNAIAQANAPFFHFCLAHYPYTTLHCSGESVGLLPHQAGNSEVGHLIIGAGRIIEQDVVRLHKAIDDGSFFTNPLLVNNLKQLAKKQQTLHIMGLLSDAGVHSHEKHLYAFLKAAQENHIKRIIIHAFTDGRDVPQKSAGSYLSKLSDYINSHTNIQLGTITGRFFAMDRDHNWQRTEETYNALTKSQEIKFDNWQDTLNYYYQQNVTDEFIPPTQLKTDITIKPNDGIIFFNFRPDRARQLAAAFTKPHFTEFPTHQLPLSFFITPTDYDDPVLQIINLLPKLEIKNTLKEVLSKNGITLFSIAETEKYAHVTYFFNALNEQPLKDEKWVIIPSIRTRTYIAYPCMSANEITAALLNSLEKKPYDFYVINYANADMVGHSGNLKATIKAIECLDKQLRTLYEEIVLKLNGAIYITGDHGNAEQMRDPESNQPFTAHTKNPVYFIVLQKNLENKKIDLPLYGLKDIAPYILKQIGIPVPPEMQ